MNESTKKKNIYNINVVERLQQKYGVSKRYITMSISGDRTSETSDKIKRDYHEMLKEMNKVLNSI